MKYKLLYNFILLNHNLKYYFNFEKVQESKIFYYTRGRL